MLLNCHLLALVCIVVDPSISYDFRSNVQPWPGILQDVQRLENSFATTSASLLISVQIVSGLHWLPVQLMVQDVR